MSWAGHSGHQLVRKSGVQERCCSWCSQCRALEQARRQCHGPALYHLVSAAVRSLAATGPYPCCRLLIALCLHALQPTLLERVQVAKAIGYMINANSTTGGGCPVPPPPNADLERFGSAMAVAILEADNKTSLFAGQTLQAVATAQKSPNITVASLTVRCSPLCAVFLGVPGRGRDQDSVSARPAECEAAMANQQATSALVQLCCSWNATVACVLPYCLTHVLVTMPASSLCAGVAHQQSGLPVCGTLPSACSKANAGLCSEAAHAALNAAEPAPSS